MAELTLSTSYLKELLNETENKLSLTTQTLHELKRSLDEAVIVSISNLRGEIIDANPLMCTITGYTLPEIIGKRHSLFNSGHHSRKFFSNLWRTVLSGKVWHGEICNKKKDGSLYWVDTTIVPMKDNEGSVFQFISFRKPISNPQLQDEKRFVEGSVRQHAARLSALGEIAATIAHEIQNPLAAILLRTQMGKKGTEDPAKLVETLSQIERVAKRIEKIISGVRLIARDGDNDPYEVLPVCNLVREAAEIIEKSFQFDDVSLNIRPIFSNLSVRVRRSQFSQVILNLLKNALDAVQSEPKKWVSVEVAEKEKMIQISIIDSGPGVPAELREKIMQPYFTTKAPGRGTGLGLSISKTIIEAHGGQLFLDPDAANTTFTILLPKAIISPSAV